MALEKIFRDLSGREFVHKSLENHDARQPTNAANLSPQLDKTCSTTQIEEPDKHTVILKVSEATRSCSTYLGYDWMLIRLLPQNLNSDFSILNTTGIALTFWQLWLIICGTTFVLSPLFDRSRFGIGLGTIDWPRECAGLLESNRGGFRQFAWYKQPAICLCRHSNDAYRDVPSMPVWCRLSNEQVQIMPHLLHLEIDPYLRGFCWHSNHLTLYIWHTQHTHFDSPLLRAEFLCTDSHHNERHMLLPGQFRSHTRNGPTHHNERCGRSPASLVEILRARLTTNPWWQLCRATTARHSADHSQWTNYRAEVWRSRNCWDPEAVIPLSVWLDMCCSTKHVSLLLSLLCSLLWQSFANRGASRTPVDTRRTSWEGKLSQQSEHTLLVPSRVCHNHECSRGYSGAKCWVC